ncbi:luciferase family protein [Haloarchaeobius sp. DFWS5]|uniref:luciferase domain-containing protein n=1 Tax=Haloarchaeobius sp. DFWS5 TaxID=3446114 RepID=UPI003EBD5461
MVRDERLVREVVDSLVTEVGSWPGVREEEHRYGGTAFLVGSREIGHVHGSGMLDIPYLRALRDQLVAEGLTNQHHLLTSSGWTTYDIVEPGDFEHARWLLRLSYLYTVNVLQQGDEVPEELVDVDVSEEVEKLQLSRAVRAAFDRRGSVKPA